MAGHGVVLALLGQGDAAVREAEHAVALAPVGDDAPTAAIALFSLALTHTRLGQQEPAIEALEKALQTPYLFTPGWLRVDPNFDPLRGNPRFEKLAAGKP
jgi:hypothetical protein